MKQSKSGSPPKRAKKRSPNVVTIRQYNELLASAQALQAQVAELEQQKWASNILFAGTLAQLGGACDVPRDTLTALRRPWEIRHEHDHENHVYRVRLLQAEELEEADKRASGVLTESAFVEAANAVLNGEVPS